MEQAFGPSGPPDRLGGQVWRAVTSRGALVVKTGPGVVDEAQGLRSLAGATAGLPVPDVLLGAPDLLVTPWVDQGARTPAHEEGLGRGLATLHAAPWPEWGGGSSWVGDCAVDPAVAPDATSFYGARLADLASRCELRQPAQRLADRLGELLPAGRPALVHGDLWWGNVLWGRDGRPWLIDPSVHGGHPEEDLAMLGLFGPVPPRVLGAYQEAGPLASGWEDRVNLFRLFPLLVHAVLFGSAYRDQAVAILRRFG